MEMTQSPCRRLDLCSRGGSFGARSCPAVRGSQLTLCVAVTGTFLRQVGIPFEGGVIRFIVNEVPKMVKNSIR